MERIIRIFDTTLRDGEQAPGCSMSLQEKIQVAQQLEKLNVDVIEAGFPAASPGDLASVREIAKIVTSTTVAGLARALPKDIDAVWEAVRYSQAPRIHTFIATSPIHMEHKLKMLPDAVVEQAVSAVEYARKFCSDVEFSAEDASRSDPDFLCRIFSAVVAAGAHVINIPDTVGYAVPGEFGALVKYIIEHTEGIEKAIVSVHCHNDLGLAVANSLAAITAGANQIECTINGIGERAGNAALEEIVMALATRKSIFDAATRIDSTQLYKTSRLVSTVTGAKVQINKAIVGENAFAHEAGIHQHGVLANRQTYEIMTPESVGIPKNSMVLGKHSGKHAFEARLKELGYSLQPSDIESIFAKFKELADRKKTVSDRDIEALVRGASAIIPEKFRLASFVVNSGTQITATATIRLALQGDGTVEQVAAGDGPVDAAYKAIDAIVQRKLELADYRLSSVTSGEDAQGEAMVKVRCEGKTWNGIGVSTDVLEASIKAYLSAINAMEWELESFKQGGEQ